MAGRRLSDGLHQAIEGGKKNAIFSPENVTLGLVTFQNYFRLYGKLSGMTARRQPKLKNSNDLRPWRS